MADSESDLETIRHRARQAVEYYQRQVAPSYTAQKGSGAAMPSQPPPPPVRSDSKYTGASTDDDLQSGLAPASSNSFYRAKMKAGIIDMRSSYNERIGMNRNRSRTFHGPHPGRARTQHYAYDASNAKAHAAVGNGRTGNRKIHRSNSNLEMDSMEMIDDRDLPSSPTGLHREYGSTSSLDLLGTSGGENFFAMLKDFRCNPDQRSPAPPKLQELLRGRVDPKSKMSNGSVSVDRDNEDTLDGKGRPKSKTKERKVRAKSITGETSAGILKKLRGGKPDIDLTSKVDDKFADEGMNEERYRRKALVHFDCQSVGVNLSDTIKRRSVGGVIRNTTTGASAASVNRNSYAGDKDDPDIIAGTDEGDGKSNNLVLSCPFFRNELGGEEERVVSLTRWTAHRRSSGPSGPSGSSSYRHPSCCGVAVLDSSTTCTGVVLPPVISHKGHIVEYVDHGAEYYKHFFHGQDHQNFFGVDENLGPVAISIKREKCSPDDRENQLGKAPYGQFQFRLICRTSELSALRVSILEDAIPSSSRLSSSRGVPVKDVLEFALPELQISCLKQGLPGPKTAEQLLKLDEQGLTKHYKVGIMYCQAGQGSEEEMYNNEYGSPAFEEFLELIGQKIRLRGFDGYRGGLDCKTDTTGTHSYYSKLDQTEIMFHISTMLPYTPNNKQQLLRKRHIGNDIVTVVFQEPGALPFSPKTVRSQFQHVFIIVRVHSPNTENVRYSLAVTRSKDVPPFGPPLSKNNSFSKSAEFVDFLMAKVINAENAAHRSDKFVTMATRTRQEYLKDLATNYTSSTSLESNSKLSKFAALGSGRKKERSKQRVVPDIFTRGALVWNVQIEDVGSASQVECYLAIAYDTIALIEEVSRDVIFTISTKMVIGWTPQMASLRLYYNHGECVLLRPHSGDPEEVQEVVQRLSAVSTGCETLEMSLKRNGLGQLGFHIQSEGIVTDVEAYGFAWQAGLRKGSRLVEICKVATATLHHDQIVDLLRTSATVRVVVVPPLESGQPRGDEKVNLTALDISGTFDLSMVRPASHSYQDSSLSSTRGSDDNTSYYSHQRTETSTSHGSHGSHGGSFDGHLSSGEEHHSRTSSRDSNDNSLSGTNSRPRNLRQTYPQHPQSQTPMSSLEYGGGGPRSRMSGGQAPQSDYYSHVPVPVTGNISRELMKQSQNTKFLLSQGMQSGEPSSAVTSLAQAVQRPSVHAALERQNATSRLVKASDDLDSGRRDVGKAGRFVAQKKSHLEVSPSSSTNSSPRSSNRNLSGMSSEESLASRLRPGVTGTIGGRQSVPASARQPPSNLQEELMRLINPDLYEQQGDGPSQKSTRGSGVRRSGRLHRTMSDESLHSNKGVSGMGEPAGLGGNDVIFTSTLPSPHSHSHPHPHPHPHHHHQSQDSARESRPRSKTGADDHSVPLLESTAGLDWENLVSVATKAIQGEGRRGRDDQPPPRPPSPKEDLLSSGDTVWHPMSSDPKEQVRELLHKVQQLQQQLQKERQQRAAAEMEVEQLRLDNVRLQEESQTAAAQLRRFTEWFFNTIDRQ